MSHVAGHLDAVDGAQLPYGRCRPAPTIRTVAAGTRCLTSGSTGGYEHRGRDVVEVAEVPEEDQDRLAIGGVVEGERLEIDAVR